VGGNQPISHPWTSVLSPPDGPTLTAFADVNTDVLRENTDVRWVGFPPSFLGEDKLSLEASLKGKDQYS
jgi:hypothetical protein